MTPPPSPSRSAEASPPVPARPGLRERKKARTRAAIQQHALRLFREQGYAETTVEQIAEAAEISPSTFFRYFPTKAEAVLTEFIDIRIFELLALAPAELNLLGAFRHALNQAFDEMSEEQMSLEMERNQLIASVPELQRGLVEEIARPIRLLAEAFALRLDLAPDEPSVLAYAGAVVGAMLAVVGPQGHDLAIDLGHDYRTRLMPALDLLEQTLVARS